MSLIAKTNDEGDIVGYEENEGQNSIFKMKRFLLAHLILLDILLFNGLPLSAQGIETESEECKSAIASVKNQIETAPQSESMQNRQLEVKFSEIQKVDYYPNYPEGRPNGYTFGINPDVALPSLMNSPVFLTNLATQVINSCDTISMVSFGTYQTNSGIRTFGLTSDGRVELFECPKDYNDYYPNYYRELTWGESCES